MCQNVPGLVVCESLTYQPCDRWPQFWKRSQSLSQNYVFLRVMFWDDFSIPEWKHRMVGWLTKWQIFERKCLEGLRKILIDCWQQDLHSVQIMISSSTLRQNVPNMYWWFYIPSLMSSNKLIRVCQTVFNKFYFIRKNPSMWNKLIFHEKG